MINTFIAAIVAMFFWGKSSKDLEEKTQLASLTRTIIYGVLCVAVLVFYVKTYQVATLRHSFQILGVKETIDSDSNVVDRVAFIRIDNRFSSGITENSELNKVKISDNDEQKEYDKIKRQGGFSIVQYLYNGNLYKKRINEDFKRHLFKQGITGNINKMKWGPSTIESCSHAYQISNMTSTLPSLIPIFPTFRTEKPVLNDNERYVKSIGCDYNSYSDSLSTKIKTYDIHGETHDYNISSGLFNYSYVTSDIMAFSFKEDGLYLNRCSTANNFINRLGFFTAADISQYSFIVSIKSDCPVDGLFITYDLPIEINPYDSCMTVTANTISIEDNLTNKGMLFHVKFPTLANLQLIRSLILTTLLTALVSLFFLNLFYCIRKKFIEFREKHISEISEVRVKSFRGQMHIILYIILASIGYWVWLIFTDNPFPLKIKYFNWIADNYIWLISGFILILLIITYLLFRKAYTIRNKKTKKKDNNK